MPLTATARQARTPAPVKYINKQRVLIFSSRGVTSRYRHLMEDLRNMVPHHKKDAKVRVRSRVVSVCGASTGAGAVGDATVPHAAVRRVCSLTPRTT